MTRTLLRIEFVQMWNHWIKHSRLKLGLWVIFVQLLFIGASWHISGSVLNQLPLDDKIILTLFITILSASHTIFSKIHHGLYFNESNRILRQLNVPQKYLFRSVIFKSVIRQILSSIPYICVIGYESSFAQSFKVSFLLLLIRVICVLVLSVAAVYLTVFLSQKMWIYTLADWGLKAIGFCAMILYLLLLFVSHGAGLRSFVHLVGDFNVWIISSGAFFIALLLLTDLCMSPLGKLYKITRQTLVERDSQLNHKRRSVKFSENRYLSLLVRDTLLNLNRAFLVRLIVLVSLSVGTELLYFVSTELPPQYIKYFPQQLFTATGHTTILLWATILMFLEPAVTLFQAEESSLRLYRLLNVEQRELLLSKATSSTILVSLPYIVFCTFLTAISGDVNIKLDAFGLLTLVQCSLVGSIISSFQICIKNQKVHSQGEWMKQVPQTLPSIVALVSGIFIVIFYTWDLYHHIPSAIGVITVGMLDLLLIIALAYPVNFFIKKMAVR